jgi:predicted dehydrogenase
MVGKVSTKKTLGVAMIGYAFMGKAHSQAWRNLNNIYDLPVDIKLISICGRDGEKVKKAAEKFGWQEWETDWKKLINRPDIDIVDICTPGDSHKEIAIAALNAGKHVLCEKPLANTVAEAEEMLEAVKRNPKSKNMVAFNYRRVPAISLAKNMVEEGLIGRIFHIRARYLQDWIVEEKFPLVWRLDKNKAGSGALGDIAAHSVDMTQFITGEKIAGVSGLLETFIKERPLLQDKNSNIIKMGKVTVDDAALFIGRTDKGSVVSFEATRFASGNRNDMGFEIYGEKGSLKFSFEDMNVLWFFDNTDDRANAGFKRILVTEENHPYLNAWWPPGHVIGYEHTFTHEIMDFVECIVKDIGASPSFADGLQVQKVLAAVEKSANNDGKYEKV